MKFGIVGLERIGLSLGKLAVERGHEVVAGDPEDSAREQAENAGMLPGATLEHVPPFGPTRTSTLNPVSPTTHPRRTQDGHAAGRPTSAPTRVP